MKFAKFMTPNLINIPRIGSIDILIKDHPILDRSVMTRIEYGSMLSFSKEKIMGYREKGKQLVKTLTSQAIRIDDVKIRYPESWRLIQVIFDITEKENYFSCDDLYHLQQPVLGRYESMLEITDHEISVSSVANRDKGIMTLGLSFLENHKSQERKDNAIESSLNGAIIRVE